MKAPNLTSAGLNQRWAATAMAALAQSGVRHVVICPGSRSTPLALAAVADSRLSTWVVVDERSAAFLALGLAKGSRRPAAVLCTSGSAGAHFLPAAIEAFEGETPLVLITADRPAELHGFKAAQTIDQKNLFGHFVTRALHFEAPEEQPARFAHLIASVSTALASQTLVGLGPVHFNFAFREPLAPTDSAAIESISVRLPHTPQVQFEPELSNVKLLLQKSKRGVIVCGPQATDDTFGPAVSALGVHLDFPVLAEAASNARFGFVDNVWSYDALLRSADCAEQLRPDLIIRFGAGLTLKSLQAFVDSADCPVVQVCGSVRRSDPQHRATEIVVGDSAHVARLLMQDHRQSHSFRASWATLQSTVESSLAAFDTAWDEPSVARSVVAAIPSNSRLLLSSSMPIRDVDSFVATGQRRLQVHCNRGANGIDGLVSTAVGLALSNQSSPTVALLGDLAALHDLGGFLVAKKHQPNLTVVVVNNDGGGIFSFLPVADKTPHFETLFGTPHQVDFETVAKLGGAHFHRALSLADLNAALESALRGGFHVIEARTDRQRNVDDHRRRFAKIEMSLKER